MMLSKKSKGSRRIAAAALLPMAALAALALSQPAVADVFSVINPESFDREVNNFSAPMQIAETDDAFSEAGTTATAATNDATETDSRTPTVAVSETQSETPAVAEGNAEPQGEQDAKVVGNKKTVYYLDGKLFTGDLTKLDPSAIGQMRVHQPTSKHPDGYMEIFSKEYLKTHETAQSQASQPKVKGDKEIFVAVEKQAEFPGGMKGLMEYLTGAVKYPEGPVENARVIVKFVVNKDGTITDPEIVKSGGKRFDDESLRIVSTMPKWEPAENNGTPVDSYFTIPIIFRAKSDASKEEQTK